MDNHLIIDPKIEKEKIINFLKKTFKEQKNIKAVLGLSGGTDSTTALYLLREVLPAKNIFAVQMDYKPRNKMEIDLKGINVINIPTKKIVDQFNNLIGSIPKFFDGKPQTAKNLVSSPFGKEETNVFFSLSRGANKKIRLGNIMARVRMIILFDLAKQINGLVCGTENKSEKLLGYFTRFGDSASDIEPLSHLYKTQIYQLAKYLKVPEKIINQSPTAGLWDGQTDEDDFGFTYKEADQVLYLMNDRSGDIMKIKNKFPNAGKIIKRFQDNKFKSETPYSL